MKELNETPSIPYPIPPYFTTRKGNHVSKTLVPPIWLLEV